MIYVNARFISDCHAELMNKPTRADAVDQTAAPTALQIATPEVAGELGVPRCAEEEQIGEPFHRFQTLKATDFSTAVKCFSEFKSAISRRIQWEEKEMFPAFLQRVGGGLENTCDTLRKEHREIIKLLDAIEVKLARANPATDAEEAALQRLLANHNHREHDVIFPAFE